MIVALIEVSVDIIKFGSAFCNLITFVGQILFRGIETTDSKFMK